MIASCVLVDYLDGLLRIDEISDDSRNGLQVECPDELEKVCFAVDACLASFQGAIAERAQLLITHHGLFWSEHIQLTGPHFARVKALICAGLGLYASHIPLDAHAGVGNNIELARIAGLQNIQPWGDYKGTTIGFIGTLPEPTSLNELNARLEATIGKGNRVSPTPNPSPTEGGELARRVF